MFLLIVLAIIILLLTLFLILAYFEIQKQHKFWENRNVFAVHVYHPLKNLWLTLFNRISFSDLTEITYNAVPDKKVYGTYTFNMPMLLIKDPEMLRQIMIKDFDHFTDHISEFLNESVDPFFGKNLFQLTGKRWHAMRTTLSPVFTGSKMRGMFALIRDCGEQLVSYFDGKFAQMATNGGKLIELDFLDTCTRFTNDVICSVAMGIKVDSLANPNNEFYKIGQYAQTFRIWRFVLVFTFKRFCKLINFRLMPSWFYDFLTNSIKETIRMREEKKIIRPDVLHILNQARKGQLKMETTAEKSEEFAVVDEAEIARPSNENLVLTEEDIVAQAFVFFVAGFANVAITMSWASYELALNPDIQEKLFNEIKQTMDECHGQLTYDILMKMKYLDMVVSETLRKWPPLNLTNRQVTKPYVLKTDEGDIKLDVGMFIGIPITGLHRDPKYYSNPLKFDPERFRDPNKICPFAYLPFGNGPRICIGARFTLMEVKVFLVYMLWKFEFVAIKRTPVPPVLKNGTSLELKDGFWLGLKQRN